MKSILKNTSLSFKLLAGGQVSILLITLSSLVIISLFFKVSEKAEKIRDTADQVTIHLQKAKIAGKNFLLSDAFDEEFYRTGDSGNLNEHRFHLSSAEQSILILIQLSIPENRKEDERLLSLVREYGVVFQDIVETFRNKGFKDWGLLGQWRRAIHEVEESISTLEVIGLQEDLLQLRRLEKDYLLLDEPKYIPEIYNQISVLREKMEGVNSEETRKVLRELSSYESNFKDYVYLQEKIGRSDSEGLHKQFEELVRSMEKVVDKIHLDATELYHQARRNFIRGSLVIYFLGIGVGISILFFFSRSISRTLNLLKTGVLRVGRGDLETKIDIESRDEIGIVSEAFNRMTDDLRRLTVSRNYVNKIIESIGDSLIVVNPWPEIARINMAALDLLGYTERELVGKSLGLILGSSQPIEVILDELNQTGHIRQYEGIFLRKDGKGITVLLSGAIMADSAGSLEGIVFIAQDITERKRAEEALKKSEHEIRLLSGKILEAQENERKRVARELHDSIGQAMTGIKFYAEKILKKLMDGKASVNPEELNQVIGMIQMTISETRKIAMGLRPSSLDDLGIKETIVWFCDQFRKIYSGLHFEIQLEVEEDQVPEQVKTAIFRVLQEALNNVVKHSGASLFRIRLEKKRDTLLLTLSDNGKGFDSHRDMLMETSEQGFGLASMKERTELSNGIFNLQTREGAGTTIQASWACFTG